MTTTAAGRALRKTIDGWSADGMTADQLDEYNAGVDAITREAADAALAGLEGRLAVALHEANVDCDYARKFDRKSCQAGDGPHSITARSIVAALEGQS